MKKLLVIAAADSTTFIDPILDELENDFEITRGKKLVSFDQVFDAIIKSDIVWLEWLDGVPLQILQVINRFPEQKYIVRCHRYELFQDRCLQAIKTLNSSKISQLIFVSEYVRQIGILHFPWMEKSVVLANQIDTDKFPFRKREKGKNLLFLGRMSYVKNLPIMLHFFYELLKIDNSYKLHIVGNITDRELFYYADNFTRKAKITKSVKFYGHIENKKLPDFMADMHFICCTSVFESQGVGILEAMATGLRPVIYSFGGAEKLFLHKYLHIDLAGFLESVLEDEYSPDEYRQYVVDNYSVQKNVWKYRDLINSV